MKENFERAARFVLKQEVEPGHETDGSLHTDPTDPGGKTRFGLSQRAYPGLDLDNLDLLGAMKIYHERWVTAGCDDLPWPKDLLTFDTDFNMSKKAVKALSVHTDPMTYLMHRLLIYYYTKPYKYFRDWAKRILDLWQEIQK